MNVHERMSVLLMLLGALCVILMAQWAHGCEPVTMHKETIPSGEYLVWIDKDCDGVCDYANLFAPVVKLKNGKVLYDLTTDMACEDADWVIETYWKLQLQRGNAL